MIDKYSWVDIGSFYLPSEIDAALLYVQLEIADEINDNRYHTWKMYYEKFRNLPIDLPCIPQGCVHNFHMFYIKVDKLEQRQKILIYLKEHEIGTVFYYVPLHSSAGGSKFGRFSGEDCYITRESNRLIRLPMWYGLSLEDIEKIVF